MKKTIFAVFAFGMSLVLPCALFAQQPEVKIFKLNTIEGTVFIKNNSLFLIDIANKAYQLKPELNPVDYNSLFVQVEAAQTKNKAINAKILGKPDKIHSVVDYYYNYTADGKEIASKKATEIKYQDFDLVKIKSSSEIEFREVESKLPIINLPPPPTPQPLPPILKHTVGTVVKANFTSAIPYIEVKDADSGKIRAILTPSNVPTIKVVEGELYGFETKNVVREKMRVEIWYEEKGEINTAKTISIISE